MSMKRGSTEQETLRLNGWGVGTRLLGTERIGDWWSQEIIEITYLKRDGRGILARTIDRVSSTGRYDITEPSEEESSWTLSCRDWICISPDSLAPSAAPPRASRATPASGEGEVGRDE